jgi:hypothetical protein
MRQDPIEIGMVGTAARLRSAERTSNRRADLKREPRIIDEAFAGFDGVHCPTSGRGMGARRMMKPALVSDLAAQLVAIDRQRERLAQLLQSIETNSVAD